MTAAATALRVGGSISLPISWRVSSTVTTILRISAFIAIHPLP